MPNQFEKLINGITERHVTNKTNPKQASKRKYNPFIDSEAIVCNKRERGCKRERVQMSEVNQMMTLDESDDSDDEPIMRIRPKKLHGGPRCNDFLSENEDEEEEVNLVELTANANDFSLLTDKNINDQLLQNHVDLEEKRRNDRSVKQAIALESIVKARNIVNNTNQTVHGNSIVGDGNIVTTNITNNIMHHHHHHYPSTMSFGFPYGIIPFQAFEQNATVERASFDDYAKAYRTKHCNNKNELKFIELLIKARMLKQTNGGVMPSEYKIDNELDIPVFDWYNRQRKMKDQWIDDEKRRLFEMC
jgi:hypothetical protein